MPDVTLLFYRGLLNTHLSFFGPLFSCVSIMLAASVANSANFNVVAGNDLSYISNATQADNDQSSDLENSFYVQVSGRESSSDFLAEFNYQVANETHSTSIFRDQSVIQGGFNGRLELIPRRVSWVFNHGRSEILSDSNGVDNPSNRVERQTFETGPTLSLRLSELDFVNLSYRRSRVGFENSSVEAGGEDSDRDLFQVSFSHMLSPLSRVSLSGSNTETEFDGSALQYHSNNVNVGYLRSVLGGRFTFNVGLNSVKSDAGPFQHSQESEGTFYDIGVTQAIKSDHHVSVKANRNITDSTVIGIDIDPGSVDESTDLAILDFLQNLSATEIVTVQRNEVTYLYSSRYRWEVGLSLSHVKNEYETDSPSQSRLSYGVNVPYRIKENRRFVGSYSWSRSTVASEEGGGVEESIVSLNYSATISQHLTWSAWSSVSFRGDSESNKNVRSSLMGAGLRYNF